MSTRYLLSPKVVLIIAGLTLLGIMILSGCGGGGNASKPTVPQPVPGIDTQYHEFPAASFTPANTTPEPPRSSFLGTPAPR